MNILGIDTSTKKANVCLKLNNNMIIDKSIDNEITHSEKLLPLINKVLAEGDCSLNNVNYLACSIGPGSFTGIRIAIATIKAFAKILNLPVFAISSLDIIAYDNTDSDYVISIMDAKNNRIYYSIYKIEHIKYQDKAIPKLIKIHDYANDIIDVALNNILITLSTEDISSNTSLNIIGDCTLQYKENFINKLKSMIPKINIVESSISGNNLIKMATNYNILGINEQFEKDYLSLDAVYVRPSQAERAKNNEL